MRDKQQTMALVARLRTAYAVAVTAVVALEGQNADRDAEVAQSLARCVLDPIADAAELLASDLENSETPS